MKAPIYIVLLAFIISACAEESKVDDAGYSTTESGLQYQLHYLGDGERIPQQGDYLTVRATYLTLSDSIIIHPVEEGETSVMQINDAAVKGGMEEGLQLLKAGDSATFVLDANAFFMQWPEIARPPWLKHIQQVKVNIKLLKIQSEKEYVEAILLEMTDEEMDEQELLAQFIDQLELDKDRHYIDGIYYVEERAGTGRMPQNGDILVVDYEGHFVNGDLFDATYDSGEQLEFRLGKEDQVIEGFEIGLRQMRVGGKSKLIIPSQLGFGSKGSNTLIVPPYTTLVYDVELKEIQ